jgi:hypothetical protein
MLPESIMILLANVTGLTLSGRFQQDPTIYRTATSQPIDLFFMLAVRTPHTGARGCRSTEDALVRTMTMLVVSMRAADA